MSVQHKDLTGAELHEPKGVDSATANQVYHADGAGSGTWTDPLSRINNLNVFDLTGVIEDISTASSNCMFVVPRACELSALRTTIDTGITVADAVISIYVNNVLKADTLTIAYSGSAKGTVDTLTIPTPYSLVEGDVVEFRSDGGSTTASRGYVTATFTV